MSPSLKMVETCPKRHIQSKKSESDTKKPNLKTTFGLDVAIFKNDGNMIIIPGRGPRLGAAPQTYDLIKNSSTTYPCSVIAFWSSSRTISTSCSSTILSTVERVLCRLRHALHIGGSSNECDGNLRRQLSHSAKFSQIWQSEFSHGTLQLLQRSIVLISRRKMAHLRRIGCFIVRQLELSGIHMQ
jgi:hypothetical protein